MQSVLNKVLLSLSLTNCVNLQLLYDMLLVVLKNHSPPPSSSPKLSGHDLYKCRLGLTLQLYKKSYVLNIIDLYMFSCCFAVMLHINNFYV